MKNEKYFFCYSYKLKTFLKSKGFLYDFTGNNPNNGKPYWGYLKTDEFCCLLEEWGKQYDKEK
jgi:hypothetical protein